MKLICFKNDWNEIFAGRYVVVIGHLPAMPFFTDGVP